MGFLADTARRVAASLAAAGKADAEWPAPEPRVGSSGNVAVRQAVAWAMGLTPSEVWRSQPYVRTVVTFLARNIAQLRLHTFQRVGESERERLRDHPVARLLARPNPNTTGYELIFSLVSDIKLYDRAYWAVGTGPDGSPRAVRIPPARVVEHIGGDPLSGIEKFKVLNVETRQYVEVPASSILYFPGWNPVDPYGLPSPPIDALKNVIAEQAAAYEFRRNVWENGGHISQTVTRPNDAPPWSKEARKTFIEDVRAQFGKGGPQRGGIILFEDGMTLNSHQFQAREAEWIDAAKLSLAIVAAVYHVNPTMVGLLDNANYSNVREFRKMLYGDTLGPDLTMLEDRINTFLVPRFDDQDDVYVEFNIAEKLQGSFEEQAAALQTAVGAPWMTRAEARGILNLPPTEGADGLVVPLNVLVGGQASPTDAAPPAEPDQVGTSSARRVAVKARAASTHEAKHQEVLGRFFRRQGASVRSAVGAGGDWWDGDRWDRELADDLYRLAVSTSQDVAGKVLESIGFGPDAYDVDRTLAFLKALTQRVAGSVNKVTKSQLDEALNGDDPTEAVAHVFEVAESSRAGQIATTAVTAVSGFGTQEAAKQAAGDRATKTWVVTSNNPRPSHAAMNGETVGIEDTFSNGAAWPGDAALDADEVAGCTCAVEITVE